MKPYISIIFERDKTTYILKIIAMIPARYGASRFPGKLMQDLGGKPVIVRTYEAAKATQLFDEVYVVTDSDVIFNEIELNGGKAIMSQKEHDCGSDRIAEAVESMDVDIVVNVQGDEPFTSREGLEQVLRVFEGADADKIDLASLMTEIHDWKEISDPNCVKVIVDKDSFALYFSRSPIPYPRDKNAAVQYYKHKGIYAFRKQALMDFYRLPMRSMEAAEKVECIRYLEYGKNIKMAISNTQGIEIDTPEDLVRANKVLKEEKKDTVNNRYRNFPMVPKVVFGSGSFDQLSSILAPQRKDKAPFIYVVDKVFEGNSEIIDRINLRFNDKLLFVSADEEPKTSQVDAIVKDTKSEFTYKPSGIIGIGGGTILDLAKAVSIMLTNKGS
ncbi:MAG: 3-deoxy-manno-octulosonate cytidylyltransferase, partial [Flavobacteriaceae bacterium]|nr:3-deoxy-manno-octulosonate cytidylyltransferase [Flavobacteriaceae bacterium]